MSCGKHFKFIFLLFFVILCHLTACRARTTDDHSVAKSNKEINLAKILPKPCGDKSKVGVKCSISPSKLHPTQFALGMRAVKEKRKNIAKIRNTLVELITYLDENAPPSVIGPNGRFYIVDGHHRTRAAADEGLKEIFVSIVKDYSDKDMDTFWQSMKEHNFVWPYDENGDGPLNPVKIPDSVLELADDPFRSLAEEVQVKGGYAETGAYYQQFEWANFFRKKINKAQVNGQYGQAVEKAMDLAKTPAARGLPGYSPRD